MNKKEILFDLVKQEALNIRKYASKEEKANLNIQEFDADNRTECIYGQMTGNCYSRRAYSLIRKCAAKVYLSDDIGLYRGNIDNLNGKPEVIKEVEDRISHYHSPIELFVSINEWDGKQENVIRLMDYIKGNDDELDFIDFESRFF